MKSPINGGGIYGLFGGSRDPNSPFELELQDARKNLPSWQRLYGRLGRGPGNMNGGGDLAMMTDMASRQYAHGGNVPTHGGSVDDALHIARKHFSLGGPDQPVAPPPQAPSNPITNDMINNAYQTFAGRAANQGELEAGLGMGNFSQVVNGIINSNDGRNYLSNIDSNGADANQGFNYGSDLINNTYKTYFNRDALADESKWWQGQLNNGEFSGLQMIDRIRNDNASNAALARPDLINSSYRTYFGRDANADEISNWNKNFDSGTTNGQFIDRLMYDQGRTNHNNSGYIKDSYLNNMYRAAGDDEVSAWKNALANGATRNQMNDSIANSSLVGDLYKEYFNRDPNANEANFWVSELNKGAGPDVLVNALESDPYSNNSAFLRDEYKGLLGRDPNQDEINYWHDQIQNKGLTYDQVDKLISDDPSSQAWQASNFEPYQVAASGSVTVAPKARTPHQWMKLMPKGEDLRERALARDKEFGLPEGTTLRMSGLESTFGTNKAAYRDNAAYKGPFQLSKEIIDKYHVKNPYDFDEASRGAAEYARDNARDFKAATGRDATAVDIWGLHNQGNAGYTRLAQNPDMPMHKVLEKYYSPQKALRAVQKNMPPGLKGVKAKDVTWGQWKPAWDQEAERKVERLFGAAPPPPQDAAPPPPPAPPAGWDMGRNYGNESSTGGFLNGQGIGVPDDGGGGGGGVGGSGGTSPHPAPHPAPHPHPPSHGNNHGITVGPLIDNATGKHFGNDWYSGGGNHHHTSGHDPYFGHYQGDNYHSYGVYGNESGYHGNHFHHQSDHNGQKKEWYEHGYNKGGRANGKEQEDDHLDYIKKRLNFREGGNVPSQLLQEDDLNNGALGDAAEFAEAQRRRTLEEHYPKPNNGSDLYAIAHDPREEPMKRYGAMGAGIASDIAKGAWDQVKKPGEALRGEWSPTDANGRVTDEAIGWGAGTGLGMMGGGTSFSSVLNDAPAGAIGMFIGKNAKGIDRAMYDTAQRDLMGYEGGPKPYGDLFSGGAHVAPKSEAEVFSNYKLTPYGQEIVGDRHFDESKNVYAPKMWGEISDANATTHYQRALDAHYARVMSDMKKDLMKTHSLTDAQFKNGWESLLRKQLRAEETTTQLRSKLSDFYDHPELYEKYPELADMPVYIDTTKGRRSLGSNTNGSFGTDNHGNPYIILARRVAKNPEQAASTTAHEVQHAIQHLEGIRALPSKEMAKRIHDRPDWTRWDEAKSDPAMQEFAAIEKSPAFEKGNEALLSLLEREYGGQDKYLEEALKRLHNEHPEYVRAAQIARDYTDRGIPFREPRRYITGDDAYLHQGIEGQSRNTQYRLDWDMDKRNSVNPNTTIPRRRHNEVDEYGFIPSNMMIHKKGGGRVGYANGSAVEGDVEYMDDRDKRPPQVGGPPPMMAETPEAVRQALSVADKQISSPHEFVQSKLFDPSDDKQLPQYDPEAGKRTAKEAALTAYGLTDAGGIQQAFGYMPKAEGGFEPSVLDDYKSGNYLAAGLGLAGTIVPGGGKLAKAAREADAVSDATKVAQEVAAPTQKAADAAAPAAGESSLWTPSAPKIIRPNESTGNTVGDVLAMNGYTDIPDEKYVYWRDALNEPATRHSQVQLYQIFNDALKSHLSLPDGMRRTANTEAMDALKPYLGETIKGVPHDLMTQNGKQAKAARELGITNRFGVPIDTWGLSLSPGMAWNDIVRICGNDEICRALCLGKKSGGYALEGAMNNEFQINLPRANSIGRTIAMFQRPREFAIRTAEEIRALDADAMKNGMALGLRMNTLSDLHPLTWEPFRNAFDASDFYDYTKHLLDARGLNHHLTYSGTGYSSPGIINPHSNWDNMIKRLDRGDNVAIVLNQKNDKPSQLRYNDSTYRVVDGDAHDFRPHDKQPKGEKGVVVALGKKEQGKGTDAASVRKKSGGFYFDYNPKKDGDTVTVPDQRPFAEEVKKARLARKGRESGGYIPFERSNHADLYPNSHHFREAIPGTNKVPHIWDTKESARKRG